MTIKKLSVSAPYCFGADPILLDNLSKVNFIFAPNGSGKTTISNNLAGQPTDDADRIDWPTAPTSLPIRVFNESYREQVLRERVDGIFTMGSASGEAVDSINEIEARKKTRREERDAWQMEIGSDGESPTGLLADIQREKDLVRESVYDAYRQVDKDISAIVFKGFRRSKVKFIEETLRRHALGSITSEYTTWESINSRIEILSSDVGLRNRMPGVTVSSVFDGQELQDLGSAESIKLESSLSDLIKSLHNEDWVSEGRQYLTNSDHCCPFCQQLLPSDFAKQLQDHFASGFDAQLQRARDIQRQVLNKINTLSPELAAIRKFVDDEEFADSRSISTLIDNIDSALIIIKTRLEEKVLHPTDNVEVEDVTNAVSALKSEILSYNEGVREHNLVVNNQAAEQRKAVKNGWNIFLSEPVVVNAIKRYKGIVTVKSERIKELRKKIDKSTNLDLEDENTISRLRGQVSNTREVADRINRTLGAMGFHRFHIDAESAITGGYRIIRSDGSPAHESLSEGEKSFLCFTYFWESIFGASESGSGPEDVIAVFDDPISSLDSDTLFLVAAHIRQAATWVTSAETNLKQLIVLTHNTQFHHEAAYGPARAGREDRHYFRLLKRVDGITTAKDDGNISKIRGSYPLLWDSVVEAAGSDQNSSLVQVGVFNIVRRIIEGYFRTIGQISDYQIPPELEVHEERMILMFHMWASSGSHTIADDIDQTIEVGSTQHFLRLFRLYFDLQGHSAHFDMMLRASNGEELTRKGAVFAPRHL